MFIEKKKINGKTYYYLKASFRVGNKIKTKTLAYIGNKKDWRKIKELKKRFDKKALEKIKKEITEEFEKQKKDWNREFLSESEIEKINHIKKEFLQKLNELDEKTKKEMFDDFLTYFIFNSNAIEGNTLTLRETDLLLNKGITPQGKTLKEINDHLNSKKVFYYIQEKNLQMNNKTIILVHDMLMENIDERKGYRTHNVRVLGAKFKSSPYKYVKTDVSILLKWYNKNKKRLHPIILSSIFHHKFEKIHPFYDGNGRTGRMIMNLILLKNNLTPIILSNKQRKTYYIVLSKADNINLTEIDKKYKSLVRFISTQMLKTFNTIFNRWG